MIGLNTPNSVEGENSTMTDARYKQIMEYLGMPNSRSLYSSLQQVAHEVEVEVRRKCAEEVATTGKVEIWSIPEPVEMSFTDTAKSQDVLVTLHSLCDDCKDGLRKTGFCEIGEETTDGKAIEKLCPICEEMKCSNARTTIILSFPNIHTLFKS